MTETCSAVLRSRRNCSSDGAERTDDGRAFHARAAVTGKARSPSVVRRLDVGRDLADSTRSCVDLAHRIGCHGSVLREIEKLTSVRSSAAVVLPVLVFRGLSSHARIRA